MLLLNHISLFFSFFFWPGGKKKSLGSGRKNRVGWVTGNKKGGGGLTKTIANCFASFV